MSVSLKEALNHRIRYTNSSGWTAEGFLTFDQGRYWLRTDDDRTFVISPGYFTKPQIEILD